MTDRQIEYREFLKSPFWASVRKQVVERDGNKCSHCGAENVTLNVHHLRSATTVLVGGIEDLLVTEAEYDVARQRPIFDTLYGVV